MTTYRIKDALKVTRPFAIFIEPCLEIEGNWNAHVVGFELDNVTFGKTPAGAVEMAAELLCMITGECGNVVWPCRSPTRAHDFSRDATMGTDDDVVRGRRCVHCNEFASNDVLEEVT